MAPRYFAVRVGALIVAALTALLVTAMPASAQVAGKYVGTVEGGQGHGFKMTFNGAVDDVYASLLGIDLDGDDEADLATYCVEIDVAAIGGIDMVEAPWSEYPGGDGDLAHPEKVLWILHNSFPTVGVDALATTTGIDGLTKRDAITGTQAAIWHFSNGAVLEDSNANVAALYAYLTGDANVGMSEQPPASLAIDPAALADVPAGEKAGPFTVQTNASEVTLSLEAPDGVKIVDEAGAELTGPVADGTRFWLSSPTGGSLGPATVTAQAEANVERGRLFVGTDNARKRTQTLIVATSQPGTANAEATASWKTATVTQPPTSTETTTTTAPTTTTTTTTTTTVAPTAAPPAQGGNLPTTGASVMTALGVGLLLLGGGIALVLLQRRRRSADDGTS